jgi:hypothetical protein
MNNHSITVKRVKKGQYIGKFKAAFYKQPLWPVACAGQKPFKVWYADTKPEVEALVYAYEKEYLSKT